MRDVVNTIKIIEGIISFDGSVLIVVIASLIIIPNEGWVVVNNPNTPNVISAIIKPGIEKTITVKMIGTARGNKLQIIRKALVPNTFDAITHSNSFARKT